MKKALIFLTLGLFYFPLSLACTDFRLTAKDGTIIITRSLEFPYEMKSNLRTMPRGNAFKTTTPNNKPGLSWNNKYGYVYLDGMGIDAPVDGMNETGLSLESLLFPGFAEYQTISAGKESSAVSYIRLGDYILGNFKTVDEVKSALPHLLVFAEKIPNQGDTVFPLHFSIFDNTGRGIVVEYTKTGLHIFDHLGVMTNSPPYDWHLTNLRNYLSLSPYNPNPVVIQGITFTSTGQGAGMLGIPGDISPPSRFVKMAIMKNTVFKTANATDTLNLAEHLINNVDIPIGYVRESTRGPATTELTQWVIFKDLTHKALYYRTYEDMTLNKIDLNKLNLSVNGPKLAHPLSHPVYIKDVTNQLIGK